MNMYSTCGVMAQIILNDPRNILQLLLSFLQQYHSKINLEMFSGSATFCSQFQQFSECKTKRHWNTIQVRNKGYQSQARSNNIYTTLIIHPTLFLCRHLVYFVMYLSWILKDFCIIHPIIHDIPNNFLLCTVRDIQHLIWQLNGSCLILYLEHWIHFVEFFLPNDFYAKSF